MNPNQYCQQLVQRHSSAFRYSLLGLALPQRQALTALQAFCVQTTRIPQECQELANAHSKLDWWRSEVERLFAHAPQHPVSKALHPYLATYNLQEEYFREMLDGVAMDLEYDLYPSFSALTLYLHRRGSVPALLAAEISGYQEQRATLRFAHEAGMLLQLFALLCQTRSAAQQGHCYLPEDEMQRCGVDLGDLLTARTTDRVRQLFILQGQRIQHCYQRAQELLPASERHAQTHLLLRMELAMALLAEIAADGYRLLEQHTQLTPLRQLWLAWRWRYMEGKRRRQLRSNPSLDKHGTEPQEK